jgi:exodeoxyribonuclease-5
MVNEETAADLLRTGAFITAFGDPAQLPPVVGRQFFTNPDFTLQEIHRQALQSPIIRQAHIIRNGGRYEPDGDNFRVVRGQINDDELLQAEAILCWKNGTKFAINQHVRKLRGFTEPHPQAGETVMCLKNAAPFGVFNGTTYKLLRPFLNGDKVIWLEVDGHEVCVPNVIFENSRTPDPNPKKCISKFEFGYSMTVHKSQGSEFASVVLVDEYCGPNDRSKWLYTGITRAIERIIILTR